MSLVVCVTTYNRAEMLGQQLETLRSLTTTDFQLVVCDDGSIDDSIAVARRFNAEVIGGRNMGIAFNKNRGLYYAIAASQASHILLLDDDTFAVELGWEQEWLRAIDRHGHVNYAPPIAESYTVYGAYTAKQPAVSRALSGQCMAFDRKVLAQIGYMDTRFGRYGGEHVDLTFRAMRLGYGGFMAKGNAFFFVLKGGLSVQASESSGTPEDMDRANALLGTLRGESIYRAPWHTDELYGVMMEDMAHILGSEPQMVRDLDIRRLRAKLEQTG